MNPPGSQRAAALLGLVALIGVLALQLPWLGRAPFDAHNFRQTQTLATIELFAKDGIQLAHAPTNYVGEPGVFVLELPLYQALSALLYHVLGPHTWIPRVLNLAATLANALLIGLIGRRLFDRQTGAAAALIYLFAPLNLVYMTSVLIDPSAITLALAAFASAHRILHPARTEAPAPAATWCILVLACACTALIKTLYLFPTCLLLAATFLARRKVSARMVGIGLCIVLGVGLFALWLKHGRQINDSSYFTRGVNPTTLLGFGPLASPAFYDVIARRFFIHIAGPGGSLLALAALSWVILRPGDESARAARFPLVVLLGTVVGYWACFAKVNFPHDYYSLIVSPFGCLLAAAGAGAVARQVTRRWPAEAWSARATVGVAGLVAAMSIGWFFYRAPLRPNPELVRLENLIRDRIERHSFGMVFAGPDMPLPVHADSPALLYAAGVRGTGRTVPDPAGAVALWREFRPHYRHLRYVVFYKLSPPDEITRDCDTRVIDDPANRLVVFAVK